MSTALPVRRGRALAAFVPLLPIAALVACKGARGGEVATHPDVPRETPGSLLADRCPVALVETRRGGTESGRYVAPGDEDRATIRRTIATLLSGGSREQAGVEAARAGFEIVDVPELAGAVLVRETSIARRGGGAYLLRLGSPSRVLVEAPHTLFDEGTLPLGCDLFHRSHARALFIETAHRYKSADKTESGQDPADVAHQAGSLYQAATEGALDATANGLLVVQVHGFAARADGARIVLSNGTKVPGDALVAKVARALLAVVDGHVLRYPEDEHELGATTNVQGALVRDRGGRFLHVELDSSLRRELLADDDARARVFGALAAALEDRK